MSDFKDRLECDLQMMSTAYLIELRDSLIDAELARREEKFRDYLKEIQAARARPSKRGV
jgi:hypothetical protein